MLMNCRHGNFDNEVWPCQACISDAARKAAVKKALDEHYGIIEQPKAESTGKMLESTVEHVEHHVAEQVAKDKA